jgi:predicted metal-dependent phosphoesterase TrpH
LIDLHTHTTASDGRQSPAELIRRAADARVEVLSVTDHDTVAGCASAAVACAQSGIEFVPGIEMTAVLDEVDVHVLGYFIDPECPSLLAFLAEQREHRIERVREMVRRLATCGISLDVDAILGPGLADSTKSAGRPWIARALVAGGFVADTNEAFARWLTRGQPAFVARSGAAPDAVFATIHKAGGVVSLAHPGLLRRDDWVRQFAGNGMDALEAYHSSHDAEATDRYLRLAEELKVAVSGGSDYHGDDSHGPGGPGSVALPREHYERLRGLRAAIRV